MSTSPEPGMVSIHVTDRNHIEHHIEVPADLGLNLMEVCVASSLPIQSVCGGLALCGGCHVYVLEDHRPVHRSAQEEETLDKLQHVKPNSRLACQLKVTDQIHNVHIQLARH